MDDFVHYPADLVSVSGVSGPMGATQSSTSPLKSEVSLNFRVSPDSVTAADIEGMPVSTFDSEGILRFYAVSEAPNGSTAPLEIMDQWIVTDMRLRHNGGPSIGDMTFPRVPPPKYYPRIRASEETRASLRQVSSKASDVNLALELGVPMTPMHENYAGEGSSAFEKVPNTGTHSTN